MNGTLHGGGLLLFAQVFALFQLVSYLPRAQSREGARKAGWHPPFLRIGMNAIFVCVTVLFAAVGDGRVLLSLSALAACTVFPLLRCYFVPRKYLAEFEIAAVSLFTFGSSWWIARRALDARWHLGSAPAAGNVAAWFLSAGLLFFLLEGGSLIVTGLLAKGGTMPPPGPATTGPPGASTQAELRHGQIIGKVERLILATLIANGQFQSIAFFFAAKGLIRSKELELRAWADYLLLGSLASFVVALAAGILMKQLLTW